MPPDGERIFGFERAEDSPGFLLWQVHSVWHRRVNAALRPLGLTHAQFVLLASLTWLTDHGASDAITQADLADHARMDVMLTSDVVRTLAAKDLVERRPHPRDARARALSVMPAGQELAARAVGVVESVDRDFFARLGDGTPDLLPLLRTLAAEPA